MMVLWRQKQGHTCQMFTCVIFFFFFFFLLW